VTGTGANLQVYSKLVDLLKQTVPLMTRVGYLRNPTTPGTDQQMALARGRPTSWVWSLSSCKRAESRS
jgi:uncharacterized membrane protein